MVGGWGVDALLGEKTRPHKDLDLLALVDDGTRLNLLLETLGYRLAELWSENRPDIDARGNPIHTAWAVQDAAGRQIDLHLIRLDAQGNGLPAWQAEGFFFNSADLAGKGVIAGQAVRCISPALQAALHTGYDLPEAHRRDLELLQERFGVGSSPA